MEDKFNSQNSDTLKNKYHTFSFCPELAAILLNQKQNKTQTALM